MNGSEWASCSQWLVCIGESGFLFFFLKLSTLLTRKVLFCGSLNLRMGGQEKGSGDCWVHLTRKAHVSLLDRYSGHIGPKDCSPPDSTKLHPANLYSRVFQNQNWVTASGLTRKFSSLD